MTLESSAPAEDLRMDVGALFGALWARALRILFVTAVLVALAYGVLMFVPKLYESSSSLLVEDRTSSFTQAATGQPQSGTGVTVDALISSQIELIKSRDTLLAVVDTLNLRSVPELNGGAGNPLTALMALIGKKPEPKSVDEAVLQALNDRLTVLRERDSAVISIFVRSADPKLAADIANAIAAEHVKRRAGQSVADTAEATAWLQQQIEQLRVKVTDADQKVADFKSKYGIFTGANGTTLPDQQISDIGKQITDAQAVRNAAEQRASLIRSLIKSGQAVEGVDDVRNSAVIQSLMQNRATLQSTLAEKLATLLPAHPTIKALNAQIDQINRQIAAEAKRIADGLAAQVTIQDGILQSLSDDLARAKLAASAQTNDGVTLDGLVREANAQRDLLNAYLIKYRDASGRTDAGSVLPDVRVVTQAAPSVVPASPKTALILGAVGFVALALQVGAVLFGELMSGRAIYDRNAAPIEPAFASEEAAADETAQPTASEPVADDARDETQDVASPPFPRHTGWAAIAEAAPHAASRDVEEDAERPAVSADLALSNLNADVALGRARLLLIGGLSEARDAAVMTDALVGAALRNGLSVCRIDAGSMRASSMPGLADLCAEQAGYGDVVHKVRENLAEVPWGQTKVLNRRSSKPVTLIEALTDIYEVVIVSTGRLGLNSTLPLFVGLPARVVVVHDGSLAPETVAAAADETAGLGFSQVQAMALPAAEIAVA